MILKDLCRQLKDLKVCFQGPEESLQRLGKDLDDVRKILQDIRRNG